MHFKQKILRFHTDMDSLFFYGFLGSIGTIVTFLGKFLNKSFLNNPLISPFGIILQKKLLQGFEVQFGGLSKNNPFKVSNDRHFLKLSLICRNPLKNVGMSKMGRATIPMLVLRKLLKSFLL